MQSAFDSEILHIGVFARFVGSCSVAQIAVMQQIRIFAMRRKPFATQRNGIFRTDFLLQKERWIQQTKRSAFERNFSVQRFIVDEFRTQGADIEQRSRGKHARRLKNIVALSVVERKHIHIVERKTPHINLSRLAIGERNAIVTYSRVSSAQTAYRNGFQSANATVILYSYTRKILHGIRNLKRIQFLNLFRRKNL